MNKPPERSVMRYIIARLKCVISGHRWYLPSSTKYHLPAGQAWGVCRRCGSVEVRKTCAS
jgi:hypothetical protein